MICEKIDYPTRIDAIKAIKALVYQKMSGFYSTYQCGKCGKFHISSGTKSKLNGCDRKRSRKKFQRRRHLWNTIKLKAS